MSIGGPVNSKSMRRLGGRFSVIAIACAAAMSTFCGGSPIAEAAEVGSAVESGEQVDAPTLEQEGTSAAVERVSAAEEVNDVEPSAAGYWQHQDERWFAWTKLGLGLANSAQLFVGHGKPNWTWAGLSAGTVATGEFFSIAAGPQFELLLANAFVRVRHVRSFSRRQPQLAGRYDRSDLQDETRPRSSYTSLSGSLYGYVPVGRFLGMWTLNADYVLDFPEEAGLFNEFFRYTMNEDRLLMSQMVWWLKTARDRLLLGPAADLALTPSRPALVRAGGSVVWRLGPHLQAQIWLTFPVNSPDSVGWLLPVWGTARIQWNWASGEPKPALL